MKKFLGAILVVLTIANEMWADRATLILPSEICHAPNNFLVSSRISIDTINLTTSLLVEGEILASNNSVEIVRTSINKGKEYDESTIWIRDKHTKKEEKLLTTVEPKDPYWYVADCDEFVEVSIDSIYVADLIHIINDNPLQIIVEGCPDYRNIYSYFIDVSTRKTWYVPANSGYLGSTYEEGYMIFLSYRYVSDPDIAGRYTFIQVFNENGLMVDCLDLEHLKLEQ